MELPTGPCKKKKKKKKTINSKQLGVTYPIILSLLSHYVFIYDQQIMRGVLEY
jgi:hypothetical protein